MRLGVCCWRDNDFGWRRVCRFNQGGDPGADVVRNGGDRRVVVVAREDAVVEVGFGRDLPGSKEKVRAVWVANSNRSPRRAHTRRDARACCRVIGVGECVDRVGADVELGDVAGDEAERRSPRRRVGGRVVVGGAGVDQTSEVRSRAGKERRDRLQLVSDALPEVGSALGRR